MGKLLDQSHRPAWAGAALLAAAVILFLWFSSALVKEKRPDLPPYLSFSTDTDGLKAIRTLMDERAGSAKEWRKSWEQLPGGREGLLISVAPSAVEEEEQEALLDWVSEGNHAVLVVHAILPDLMLEGLEETAVDRGTVESGEKPPVLEAVRYEANVASGSYQVELPQAEVRLASSKEQTVLMKDEKGILGARYPYGSGRVTVLLTPEWLFNERILNAGHFELLWPVLLEESQGRKIWFDEYYHGYREDPALYQVYPGWLVAALAEAALAVVLWLLFKGKRFGPLRTPREWVVLRGDETLLALAGWYRRRELCRDSILAQEQYLRHLCQERWGVRASAPVEELTAAYRNFGLGQSAEGLERMLRKLEGLRSGGRYSPKEFLEDSQRLAEFTADLDRKGSGANHGTVD